MPVIEQPVDISSDPNNSINTDNENQEVPIKVESSEIERPINNNEETVKTEENIDIIANE